MFNHTRNMEAKNESLRILNNFTNMKFIIFLVLGVFLFSVAVFQNEPWILTYNVEDFVQNFTQNLKNPEVFILWTGWRSGSTFMGDLLAESKDKIFYSYEPLHWLGVQVFSEENKITRIAVNAIKGLSMCNVAADQEMYDHMYNENQRYFADHNPMLNGLRCPESGKCKDPKPLQSLCLKSNIHLIKILRLSLSHAEEILMANPNVKIISTVRDPRPMISSRIQLPWCISATCKSPEKVCELMTDDHQYAELLLKKYPNRFFRLRYEDFSLDAEKMYGILWSKLGQIYDYKVQQKVASYCSRNSIKSFFSNYETQINSKEHVFAWRPRKISYHMIKIYEKACNDTLESLGYQVFGSRNNYANLSIPVLNKKPHDYL